MEDINSNMTHTVIGLIAKGNKPCYHSAYKFASYRVNIILFRYKNPYNTISDITQKLISNFTSYKHHLTSC